VVRLADPWREIDISRLVEVTKICGIGWISGLEPGLDPTPKWIDVVIPQSF
jgi:hypothetical protein